MNAVLLWAAFATCVSPLTQNFPEPQLPVAGKPVIEYLVDQIIELPHVDCLHGVTNDKLCEQFSRSGDQINGSVPTSIPIIVHNDDC